MTSKVWSVFFRFMAFAAGGALVGIVVLGFWSCGDATSPTHLPLTLALTAWVILVTGFTFWAVGR